jgi:hypothetical protein
VFFCSLCNGPIQDGERFDRQVSGWERKALSTARRGGSDVLLREHTDRVAHSRCVDASKAGISPQQEAML